MCACECLVCAIPCGNAITLRLLAGAQCAPPLRSVHAFISAANNLQGMILASSSGTGIALILGQHRTIPALRLKHRSGSCVAKMLDNIGLRYPHRASGAKAPRTLRPLPLLLFAVSATGGAHLCSIQYYLRFWLSSCRTSLAVSALRIMRYCLRQSVFIISVGWGIRSRRNIGYVDISNFCNVHGITAERASFIMFRNGLERSGALGEIPLWAIPPTQLFFPFLAP